MFGINEGYIEKSPINIKSFGGDLMFRSLNGLGHLSSVAPNIPTVTIFDRSEIVF